MWFLFRNFPLIPFNVCGAWDSKGGAANPPSHLENKIPYIKHRKGWWGISGKEPKWDGYASMRGMNLFYFVLSNPEAGSSEWLWFTTLNFTILNSFPSNLLSSGGWWVVGWGFLLRTSIVHLKEVMISWDWAIQKSR